MSILESRLLFSKKFRNMLRNLDNNISKSILDAEGKNIDGDFTMIDIDQNSEDAFISFSTEKNILSRVPDSDFYFKGYEYTSIPDNLFKTGGRNNMRIGKFTKKIVKNASDRDIEVFVNSIKSKLKLEGYKISIIDGSDIAKYYKKSACVKTSVGGTLLHSCMVDKDDSIFSIYTKNPEVCKMLIMTNTNDELVARALLWKVQIDKKESMNMNSRNRNRIADKIDLIPNESWLMDRVYYTEDWMQNSFFNYCEDNKYTYRKQSHAYFMYNSIEYYYLKFYVKVKKINYGSFPYLDTFSFYDVKNAMLSNYEGESGFRLHGLNGNYTPTGGLFRRIRNIGINTIRSFRDYE